MNISQILIRHFLISSFNINDITIIINMSVTKNILAPDAYIVGDILIANAEQIAAKYNIIDKYFISILSNISKNITGIINTTHNKIEVGKNIFISS